MYFCRIWRCAMHPIQNSYIQKCLQYIVSWMQLSYSLKLVYKVEHAMSLSEKKGKEKTAIFCFYYLCPLFLWALKGNQSCHGWCGRFAIKKKVNLMAVSKSKKKKKMYRHDDDRDYVTFFGSIGRSFWSRMLIFFFWQTPSVSYLAFGMTLSYLPFLQAFLYFPFWSKALEDEHVKKKKITGNSLALQFVRYKWNCLCDGVNNFQSFFTFSW